MRRRTGRAAAKSSAGGAGRGTPGPPTLFLLPALLVMAIITFYPARLPGLDVLHRLRAQEPAGRARRARTTSGLENYGRILDNNIVIPNFDFLRILVFNLFWAFSNVVIHVVLGVAIALILNVKGLRFKRIYRAIYILPVVIPPIIVATVWRNMFDPQLRRGRTS